jgi:hypothetical protein
VASPSGSRRSLSIADDRVVQYDFHDYLLLNVAEMSEFEVHIVANRVGPRSAAEAGFRRWLPQWPAPYFPQLAVRVRSLPIRADAFMRR